jgi:hypothetical protein
VAVPLKVPLIVGVVIVGDVPSTTLEPLPVTVAPISWLLAFEASTGSEAVIDPPLTFTTVTALEPLVVASPLSSAAVIADALPRTKPVSVVLVPVPPLATGSAPVTIEDPPARLSAANAGVADEPCERYGTPLVELGATPVIALELENTAAWYAAGEPLVVTVPVVAVVQVIVLPPWLVRTWPALPAVAGRMKL